MLARYKHKFQQTTEIIDSDSLLFNMFYYLTISIIHQIVFL